MSRPLADIPAIGLLACLSACSSPVAVIENATTESVSVEIHSDIGESQTARIPANTSIHLNISGKDKRLWIVATFTDGRSLESEKLYVTSQGVVTGTITDKQVSINYEL